MSETMMSWTKKAVIPADGAQRVMRRAVQLRRALGLGVDHAFEDAACSLGVTPRRVRGLIRGEVFQVALDEYRALVHRHWADVHRTTADVHQMLIQIEKDAEQEWLEQHQLSLDLSAPTSPRGGPGSVPKGRAKR